MQAVILSFDSLAANSLGCYGNEWIETPNFDRLAAVGAVFDHHFADVVGRNARKAWCNGQQTLLTGDAVLATSLGHRLRSVGVRSTLIVANPDAEWFRAVDADVIQVVQGNDTADAPPQDVSIAQLVKAGLTALQTERQAQSSRLLWLHAPTPGPPPTGFESLYFEDFEERGQFVAELPDDERKRHPAVQAGAVSLIDYWLGELLTAIESCSSPEPTLLIVTAAEGYPWHQIELSNSDDSHCVRPALSEQLMRAPLLLRVFADDRGHDLVSLRSNRLVQTCDLVPTLLEWFGLSSTTIPGPGVGQSWLQELTESVPARPALRIGSDLGAQAIRTADWLTIRESTKSAAETDAAITEWLFAKPDDPWDVNDVAVQQAELVRDLWCRFS